MTADLFPDAEVVVDGTDSIERDTWLAARRQGIGGSDAAIIAGLDSSYASYWTLWRNKAHGDEVPRTDYDDRDAEMGHLIEPVIRDKTARDLAVSIVKPEVMLRSKRWPWMLCNLDGYVLGAGQALGLGDESHGVYEGKNVREAQAWQWRTEPDALPLKVECQVQWNMAVTGYTWAVVAALLGGNDHVVRIVERDDDIIDALVARSLAFWESVEAGHEPDPDGSYPATQLAKALAGRAVAEKRVQHDRAVVLELLTERCRLDAALKPLDAAKKAIDNRLRLLSGDAEVVVDEFDQTLFTYKADAKGSRRLFIPAKVKKELAA